MAVALRAGDLRIRGRERVSCPSWAAFCRELEERNLECVIETFGGWAHFDAATSDPRAFVVHGKGGVIRAVVWQGKRRRFWVTSAGVWSRHADAALCRDLERVGEASGIGQMSTPSRLGDALQRRSWLRSQGWRWETRPNLPSRDELLRHQVGGRAQTHSIGSRFTGVWEIDQRDAYAFAWALPKPSGPAMATPDATRPGDGEVTAWGPVRFTIPEGGLSCLGPLSVREADGQLAWPVVQGTYRGWAWAEEAAMARSAGVRVEPDGVGIAWRRWVTEKSWTEEISAARRKAGGWGSLLKMATVASIGRHGRDGTGWTEVRMPTEQDIGYGPGSRFYGQRRLDLPSMTHWYSFALMQARRRLWHRAVAERLAGRKVLAVETDSIIMDGPPLGPVVTRGDDLPGDWSVRRADCEVWTPALRWAIFGAGEGRTPGLPGEMRASWLAAHAPPAA